MSVFDVNLMLTTCWILDTQPKNNKISTSADVSIGHEFNIDIRR